MTNPISSVHQEFPNRRLSIEEAPAALSPATAPVVKPECETNPEADSIQLPSGFQFYTQKSLSLKPLRGLHQAKFTRAARERSNKHMLDAISTLLPPNWSAYDLTIQDFYWILYYLRINCYTKTSFLHTAVCTSHDHLSKVNSGEWAKSTLTTVVPITKTTLKDKSFEPSPKDPGLDEGVFSGGTLSVGPTLAGDLVSVADFLDGDLSSLSEADKATFKDLISLDSIEKEYLTELACLLRIPGQSHRENFYQRLDAAAQLTVDEVKLVQEFGVSVSDYGPEETITTTCGKCGAVIKTSVSITAHSFL